MEGGEEYGNKPDAFFDSLSDTVAPLVRELGKIIRKALPKASESIKWGMPVYGANQKKMVCAI